MRFFLYIEFFNIIIFANWKKIIHNQNPIFLFMIFIKRFWCNINNKIIIKTINSNNNFFFDFYIYIFIIYI